MGTVYRARDDRLARDVAVKVLLDGRPGRQDDHARLLWEARAASALNHPNIVAVFDIGTDDGVSYIVSELVDGEPLRRVLDRGPLDIRRLLAVATQIAEGMAAAHAAGITHGDLKPENVLIARDGRAKIVDFGLATGSGPPSACDGTPARGADTVPGLIVGTVAYASPECAQGRAIDVRADQFSFGVMLFEMATGAQPFKRPSAVETLNAIIHDEAPDATARNPKVPQSLQWILDRCLAKMPQERYASTADLVLDLRAVRERVLRQPAAAGRPRPGLRRPLVAAAAGALIGAASVTVWLFGTWRPGVSSGTYTPLAADPGFQGEPSWSPDGTTLAYVADVNGVLQVFTRGVTASKRFQITSGSFDCNNPFWSPKGDYIYYHSARGERVALFRTVNGTPEPIQDNAARAALSPDGNTLAFVKEESDQGGALALWLASPQTATGTKLELPPARNGYSFLLPQFSPDGKQLLVEFKGWFTDRAVPATGFVSIALTDRRARLVLPSLAGNLTTQSFSWMPDSRHIVTMMGDVRAPAEHLWMADVATDRAWPITLGVESEGFPAVSRDGRIAYTQAETNFDVVRLPLNGSGPQTLLSTSFNEYDPAWSSRREFAYVTDRAGPLEIWLRSEDGQWDQPLVKSDQFSSWTIALGSLSFSPKGERVAYQRLSTEGYRIWLSSREGGAPIRLASGDVYQDAPTWSPEGDWVAFVQALGGKWDLVKAQPGRTADVIARDAVVPASRPQWSPNGEWIAFQSPAGLSLIRPDGTGRRLISELFPNGELSQSVNEDWLTFAWNPTDNQLYGLRRDDDRVHVSLAALNPANGKLRVIGHYPDPLPIANQPIRGFTWTGREFATSIAHVKSDIWILDGFGRPPSVLRRLGFF